MPYRDFDIDSLAAYLHLTPAQVKRLAERDKIPGRRVGGEWVFPNQEIHHWLEHRIGLSDEELSEVEDVLHRQSGGVHPEDLTIAELLQESAVAVPLPARTRSSVIDKMMKLAAETGLLWDPKRMGEAVRKREELHTTALENGIALMHPRRPMPSILGGPLIAMGKTVSGIPFGQGAPLTDIFFLICSTEDRGHLHVLARLSRILSTEGVLDKLRNSETSSEARNLLIDKEAELC